MAKQITHGTEAEIQLPLEEVSRFQRLFPNPSWLVWGRASHHQRLAPTFPLIDNCLITKRDFPEMEASLWLNEKSRVSLKVGSLPYAVGKQPSTVAYRGFLAPRAKMGIGAPFPRRVRLTIGGSWAEPQTPTLLGEFGCKWNPFLNSVNTIFNL